MSSDKKLGGPSTPRKRKRPKPSLPSEDPKLVHSISQRSSDNASVGRVSITSLILIYASKYLRFGKRQIARYLGLFLGLIGLSIALYFVWQYFLK